MHKRSIAALLASVFIASTAVVPSSAQTASWREPVAELLGRRGRALYVGDTAGFDDTMRFAPRGFKARTRASARRLRALGLSHYSLSLDTDTDPDLSEGLLGRPVADEVHAVSALEHLGFRGYDESPSSDPVVFTVIRRGSVWSVVADDDLSDLGLSPPRGPWDVADLTRVSGGGVAVLTHTSTSVARSILAATRTAIAYDSRAWPLPWRKRIIVIIPRSTSELAGILQTTFDLGPFVAFAVSSLDRTGGGYHLTANRVYVQPGTFFSYSKGYQADTLSHEMLHVASRPSAGPFTPAWLDEGVAQNYGERSSPRTPTLARAVRAGTFDGHLPTDEQFSFGGRDRIHLSYEEASSFIAFLQRRFGHDAGARLYDKLGRESVVSFGTGAYHLDRAARAAFGTGIDSLERAWARDVRTRF